MHSDLPETKDIAQMHNAQTGIRLCAQSLPLPDGASGNYTWLQRMEWESGDSLVITLAYTSPVPKEGLAYASWRFTVTSEKKIRLQRLQEDTEYGVRLQHQTQDWAHIVEGYELKPHGTMSPTWDFLNVGRLATNDRMAFAPLKGGQIYTDFCAIERGAMLGRITIPDGEGYEGAEFAGNYLCITTRLRKDVSGRTRKVTIWNLHPFKRIGEVEAWASICENGQQSH